jgi:deazaflavin-dependent oxidoreductase (nitroreductase family)
MAEDKGTVRGRSPKGWLRLVLRLPILLYRVHMGWLLGSRFLLLRHTGRKSGMRHSTVLEIVDSVSATQTCVVVSGWGEKAQWLKNITVNPDVDLTLGIRTQRARARRMRRNEAESALRNYARKHPRAAQQLARVILGGLSGSPDVDIALLAALVPVVELQLLNNTELP